MSDKKITDLPVASTINPDDISVLVSNGTDYQFAFATLLQLISSNLTVGANISFGTTLPQNNTGSNGDVFINTVTGSFAQKTVNTWAVVYTIPSSGGSTSGTILYGLGLPGTTTGNNNDTYINTGTGIFYKKAAGIWNQVFSMQTGPAGAAGTPGTNGSNGTNGFSILNGTTIPSNSTTGNNGDFFINITNYTMYGPKTSGEWPIGVSLIPPGTPSGGTTGQMLSKASDSDLDTTWINLPMPDLSAYVPYLGADNDLNIGYNDIYTNQTVAVLNSNNEVIASLRTNGANGFIGVVTNAFGDPGIGSISDGALIGFNLTPVNFYGMGIGAERLGLYDIWFQTGTANGGGYRFYVGGNEKLTLSYNGDLSSDTYNSSHYGDNSYTQRGYTDSKFVSYSDAIQDVNLGENGIISYSVGTNSIGGIDGQGGLIEFLNSQLKLIASEFDGITLISSGSHTMATFNDATSGADNPGITFFYNLNMGYNNIATSDSLILAESAYITFINGSTGEQRYMGFDDYTNSIQISAHGEPAIGFTLNANIVKYSGGEAVDTVAWLGADNNFTSGYNYFQNIASTGIIYNNGGISVSGGGIGIATGGNLELDGGNIFLNGYPVYDVNSNDSRYALTYADNVFFGSNQFNGFQTFDGGITFVYTSGVLFQNSALTADIFIGVDAAVGGNTRILFPADKNGTVALIEDFANIPFDDIIEGSLASVNNVVDTKIHVKIDGVDYYLLATTSNS